MDGGRGRREVIGEEWREGEEGGRGRKEGGGGRREVIGEEWREGEEGGRF